MYGNCSCARLVRLTLFELWHVWNRVVSSPSYCMRLAHHVTKFNGLVAPRPLAYLFQCSLPRAMHTSALFGLAQSCSAQLLARHICKFHIRRHTVQFHQSCASHQTTACHHQTAACLPICLRRSGYYDRRSTLWLASCHRTPSRQTRQHGPCQPLVAGSQRQPLLILHQPQHIQPKVGRKVQKHRSRQPGPLLFIDRVPLQS